MRGVLGNFFLPSATEMKAWLFVMEKVRKKRKRYEIIRRQAAQ
nr:MAG TPA: hypothetical protein [Caudoviricetes sp.]